MLKSSKPWKDGFYERLRNPDYAVEYIKASAELCDPLDKWEAIAVAIRDIVKANNLKVAEE